MKIEVLLSLFHSVRSWSVENSARSARPCRILELMLALYLVDSADFKRWECRFGQRRFVSERKVPAILEPARCCRSDCGKSWSVDTRREVQTSTTQILAKLKGVVSYRKSKFKSRTRCMWDLKILTAQSQSSYFNNQPTFQHFMDLCFSLHFGGEEFLLDSGK